MEHDGSINTDGIVVIRREIQRGNTLFVIGKRTSVTICILDYFVWRWSENFPLRFLNEERRVAMLINAKQQCLLVLDVLRSRTMYTIVLQVDMNGIQACGMNGDA